MSREVRDNEMARTEHEVNTRWQEFIDAFFADSKEFHEEAVVAHMTLTQAGYHRAAWLVTNTMMYLFALKAQKKHEDMKKEEAR